MLAHPMQNQDLTQRSETVAEIRNHEMNRIQGEASQAASHMRRKEVLKHETVQNSQNAELDPDGKNEAEREARKWAQHEKEEHSDGDSDPHHDRPRHLDGGDHLDILA